VGSTVVLLIEFEPSIVKINIILLEVRHETDQVQCDSNSWDKPSDNLPPGRVALIWIVDIILKDTNEHESEDAWTDELNAKTPV
jgi:lysophospholipid acyltransferase (LPLAT)-like uncharacterized protein